MRRRRLSRCAIGAFAGAAVALLGSGAMAEQLNNGIPVGTLGHFDADVDTGGEVSSANLTAHRQASNDLHTEDVIFDYFTYIDTGAIGNAAHLTGSAPVLSNGHVTSNGTFQGAAGNTIAWTADSTMNSGSPGVLTTVYTLTAQTGALGAARLYQYLDEDLEDPGDDVFLTRGSSATNDLQLFTIDNTEVYGVSHSGALSQGQGLSNATFAGWAVSRFNLMKPLIEGTGQAVSLTGEINTAELPLLNHPDLGSVRGPKDIVSTLAWDVDPNATTATIVTTLGGVPDITILPPPPEPIPEPASLSVLGIALAGLALRRSRRA